jgi:hypothetical protein
MVIEQLLAFNRGKSSLAASQQEATIMLPKVLGQDLTKHTITLVA